MTDDILIVAQLKQLHVTNLYWLREAQYGRDQPGTDHIKNFNQKMEI